MRQEEPQTGVWKKINRHFENKYQFLVFGGVFIWKVFVNNKYQFLVFGGAFIWKVFINFLSTEDIF